MKRIAVKCSEAQWKRMVWPRYANRRHKDLGEMSEAELQWALKMLRTRKSRAVPTL